jgi:hypothetical protein
VPARARRANGGGRASTGRRTDLGTVRQWARRNGHGIADRGRIPTSILEAYDAAH